MQGFNVDEIQNRDDIADICSDLNKLVRKKNNAGDKGKVAQAKEAIEEKMILLEAAMKRDRPASGMNVGTEGSMGTLHTEAEQPEAENEGMNVLLRTDKRNTKYYTVISKEKAREEIAGLIEYYPGHNFYAVTDIMDDEGAECFAVVMDSSQKNPFAYYPALDSARTETERKKIMEGFLSGMEEHYIYSKPTDFFAQ